MKYLVATLLATLLILPTAWAEPPEDPEKEDETKVEITIDRDEDSSEDSEDEKQEVIEKILKKLEKSLDTEDLSDSGREEVREGLREALSVLKEFDDFDIRVGSDESFMGMLIGMIFVILVFGGPVIVVAIVLYSSYRKRRLTHDTINAYVESGKDIPNEVLTGLQKQTNPKSNLQKGLVMVGVGLGIFVCFILVGAIEAGAFGLIPLFIGLAQLLVWKLEKGKENGLEH